MTSKEMTTRYHLMLWYAEPKTKLSFAHIIYHIDSIQTICDGYWVFNAIKYLSHDAHSTPHSSISASSHSNKDKTFGKQPSQHSIKRSSDKTDRFTFAKALNWYRLAGTMGIPNRIGSPSNNPIKMPSKRNYRWPINTASTESNYFGSGCKQQTKPLAGICAPEPPGGCDCRWRNE